MNPPTREAAWAILVEYTQSQPLRRHALAVEAAMRTLARSRGVVDSAEVERWGIVGMVHDFDYERWPTEEGHVWRGMEILQQRGWPEDVIRAVGAHAPYTGIEPQTLMEKGILAADELTGFVGACALVRPSKRIADLPVESVLKRMKEKAFARSVDRRCVLRGAEVWGTPLGELTALVIRSQIPIAERLGLAGVPAPLLPEDPVPDVPEPPEASGQSA